LLPENPIANKLQPNSESPSKTKKLLVLEGLSLIARNLFAGGLRGRRSMLADLF
jgi:hypothetical protein